MSEQAVVMFKILIPLLAIAILQMVLSAPVTPITTNDPSQIQVVKFINKSNQTGKYFVIYELSNGIIHTESGVLPDGSDKQSFAAEGTYWFVGPDGITYGINYYVDQDGFHQLIGSGAGIDQGVLKSLIG